KGRRRDGGTEGRRENCATERWTFGPTATRGFLHVLKMRLVLASNPPSGWTLGPLFVPTSLRPYVPSSLSPFLSTLQHSSPSGHYPRGGYLRWRFATRSLRASKVCESELSC